MDFLIEDVHDLSYVKFIATYALTFFGYIISVLASVNQDSLLLATLQYLLSYLDLLKRFVKIGNSLLDTVNSLLIY